MLRQFVKYWKVSEILVECCRKLLFKEWDSQRVHSWLNKPAQKRMGLRGIPRCEVKVVHRVK